MRVQREANRGSLRPGDSFRFAGEVAAGAPGTAEHTHTFLADGFIDDLRVTFNAGQEDDVHVYVQVYQYDGDDPRNVVRLFGDAYIVGEKVVKEYRPQFPYRRGEKLRVYIENHDAVNAHRYDVEMNITYSFGA